jgi:Cft2 family RNA processing exonuclease
MTFSPNSISQFSILNSPPSGSPTNSPLFHAPVLGSFFQCDPDLRLTGSDVYLDPHEPRPLGVISHAHSDHIEAHQQFIATPATAAFLRIRIAHDLRATELGFDTPHQTGDFSISLSPAGHVLGSAMILARRGGESLLYTGDFRLRRSLTAEEARVPVCDAVITESTYGSPEWRFPDRATLQSQLVDLCRSILGRGRTPVLLAYSLGKAQEAMAMLREEKFPLVVHPVVARIAGVYERHGVDLGRYEIWTSQPSMIGPRATTDLRQKVVIVPPHMDRDIRRIRNRELVSLTGWALHRPMSGVDHALPLSDHADFDELLELVERSQAKIVYVTHGAQKFARELRSRGVRAEFLKPRKQMRLF